MFGGKKKDARSGPRADRSNNRLSQFGLMDMPGTDDFGNMDADNGDANVDDATLEAELQELMYGGGKTRKPVPKKRAMPSADLNSMMAACLADIPSDDDNVEGDFDENELAQELAELDPSLASPSPASAAEPCDEPCAGQAMLTTIETRIANYTQAEQNAKLAGEGARARRFARGLTTLTGLRKKVIAGKPVNDDDIPPAVVVPSTMPKTSSSPTNVETSTAPIPEAASYEPPAPSPAPRQLPPSNTAQNIKRAPSVEQDSPAVREVRLQREQFKSLALAAKKSGDKETAVANLRKVKECDALVKKLRAGEISVVDDSSINVSHMLEQMERQTASPAPAPAPARQISRDEPVQIPEELPPPDPSVFGAPPPPSSVEEALQQRLAKYRQDETKAKNEGNQSKVRRLGRICKQYQDAMKLHHAGKPIPVGELPTPPGFAPIPVGAPPAAAAPAVAASTQAATGAAAAATPPKSPGAGKRGAQQAAGAAGPMVKNTTRDKQLLLLKKRQQQFREAALEAKKAGQMDEAKEYLRQYKGFDKVIEAAESGLPVDINTLPVPPQQQTAASMGFEIVSRDVGLETGDRQEMFSKLEKDLIAQVKMCDHNRLHFKSTGDVASANKFQQMLEHTKKDLDALRFAFKRGDAVPKFHYETRAFSKIICNTDLSDTDLEIHVVQAINLGKDLDTYCRIEFPYPKDNPYRDKTSVVKSNGVGSPAFDHKSLVAVNPKDKSYQRTFKRHSVKVEVFSRGGFLRSDVCIGTASAKLQPLETQCEIHDSYPLMDGRRAVGGNLEVRVRVRNPLLTKQVDKVQEKWLVISFK